MRFYKRSLIPLLLMGLVLTSCFKDPEIDPNQIANDWETDILAPIMRTRMFLEDAANLSDVASTVKIASSTLNPLWNGPMFVPPVSGLSSESAPSEFGITDYFQKIYTDTLNMTVTLTNELPIPINRGTILVFRNKEVGSIISKRELDKDVLPGENYQFEFLIYNEGNNPPLVESTIEFYLEDFRTQGSDGKIVDFTNTSVRFEFLLNWIRIHEILVNSDQQFADTLQFDFELDIENDSLFNQAAEGKLIAFLESGMPLNILWEMDILDENGDFLMNFGDQDINLPPAKTDNTTGVVLENQKTKIEITLNETELDKLSRARKIRTNYDINTLGLGEGGVVRINGNSFVDIQLVANLIVKPAKFEWEGE
ncbi:MAG: hypothetical protein KDC92_10705 [Bacteroidetes bacterium]|nr:hypothetical protein [Bacteroidota bacterium]